MLPINCEFCTSMLYGTKHYVKHIKLLFKHIRLMHENFEFMKCHISG